MKCEELLNGTRDPESEGDSQSSGVQSVQSDSESGSGVTMEKQCNAMAGCVMGSKLSLEGEDQVGRLSRNLLPLLYPFFKLCISIGTFLLCTCYGFLEKDDIIVI